MKADLPKVGAVVLGAAGYGGGELLRLLAGHPAVASVQAVSKSHAGKPLWSAHPNLRGFVPGDFRAEADWDSFPGAEPIVVFSAQPHVTLAKELEALEAAWQSAGIADRVTLIDLSGDFRVREAGVFAEAYGQAHPAPHRLQDFVYGLSEWNGAALKGATRIANPGCFATGVQLALLPLADLDLGFVAVGGVTGSSGSGALPSETTHHPTRAGDFRAYKPLKHQHQAEIVQSLAARGATFDLAFVPHSAPLVRGIFITAQFRLPEGVDGPALKARFHAAYGATPFVRILDGSPRLNAVNGSNACDVAVVVEGRQAVVFAALDNLLKGMAGQAVQNMNLALGLEETAGLWSAGGYPG
ncbi:MAG: N-acetyl-gamma-glutamyl-phosphate reductase [Holophagaceae bacterium]|nr:N-acetyl-gamma-glutamyl-phosphate reductase [Holophagaceae bacterium]